jgi:hypothetical protein
MDDAFCGGGDTNIGLSSSAIPIQASAVTMIKAAIFMGDPRYIKGLSYNVGTCAAQGVSQFTACSSDDNILTILVRSKTIRIFMPIRCQGQVIL